MGLNDRRKRFVDEYLIDLNGTQAAIRAGYSQKTANRISSKLTEDEEVREAIRERLKEKTKELIATQDDILQELTVIAFGKKAYPAYNMYGKKYNQLPVLKERLQALEMLGRYYSLFTDKIKFTEDTALNINIKGDFDEC